MRRDTVRSKRPVRVLAVDDSAVMRSILRLLFDRLRERGERPALELCGVVPDGVECMEAVHRLRPDVLLLDLEMPRMDGLDVLERLRRELPALPVIMCSGYTERGARSTLDALARGAADYVTKPAESRDLNSAVENLTEQLVPRIVALALEGGSMPGVQVRSRAEEAGGGAPVEVVTIGVSTGGPSALEQMLPKLPADYPAPVLIVQHMPKLFTRALADRLNRCCRLKVELGYEGAVVRPGTIWLAPGDAHMEVMEAPGGGTGSTHPLIRLHREEPLHHCMPAVDYLFASAARTYGAGTLALVMTGMGSDGLAGSRTVHDAGGTVLVQDMATSAVWGMPGRVSRAGIASAVLPLPALASELRRRARRPSSCRSFTDGRVESYVEATQRVVVAASRPEVMYGLL